MTPRPVPTAIPAWRVPLLIALTVLAVLLPTPPASAVTSSAAETRVGASRPAVTVAVGVHECVTAGQRPVRGPSQPQVVSGSSVAAEGGPLFRGTSAGYPGSAGTQRVGITPTSTDPVVGTAFATHSQQFGNGVLHTARPADLAGAKTYPGYLSYEAEVGVGMLPTDFTARSSLTVSSAQARSVLADIGVSVPGSLPSPAALGQFLQNSPRLRPEQVAQFMRGIGAG